MVTPSHIDAYSDALAVFGTAGIVVPLLRRRGVSLVLGYLAAATPGIESVTDNLRVMPSTAGG